MLNVERGASFESSSVVLSAVSSAEYHLVAHFLLVLEAIVIVRSTKR